MATSSMPDSSAPSRTAAARGCRSCGRRWSRPTTAPISRSSSRTSTSSSSASPARTASSFLSSTKRTGGKAPILGGMTAVDEALLQQMGDEALGVISTCWYSAQIDIPTNKKFVEGMNRDYKVDPGFYAAATYTNGAVLEAALAKISTKIEDKNALMAALRGGDKIRTA